MRIARLYDVDDAGQPYFADTRARIHDDAERQRVGGYLAGGSAILATTARLPDVLDPSRGDAVPISYITDGTWIWSAGLGYYVVNHGIAPEDEFVEHMRRHEYRAPRPDDATLRAALAELQASWDEARAQRAADAADR